MPIKCDYCDWVGDDWWQHHKDYPDHYSGLDIQEKKP